MSKARFAASYAGWTDLTKRPPMASWLLKYTKEYILSLHGKSPLRRSWIYWTNLWWATPTWLTEAMRDEIKRIYATCPEGWNVDHIVPLDSPLVSGLHVPWNLEHLSFIDNMRKGNKWWPDGPHDSITGPNPEQFELFGDNEQFKLPLNEKR